MITRFREALTNRVVQFNAMKNLWPVSWSPPTSIRIADTIATLKEQGVTIVSDSLDDRQVDDFVSRADYRFYYPGYYEGRDAVRLKKIREHFMAAKLLDLNSQDTYLDIASQHSPAPVIYERLFGCRVLRQDLEYPQGCHGRVIGGSAGKMPVEGGSVTKMGLHCSLEHFEGDEDIALMKEAYRVLATGGRLVIVPLYLSDEYFVVTQPSLWSHLPHEQRPAFPSDARIYASRNSGNRYERYFDARHFLTRLVANGRMEMRIHSFGTSEIYGPGQMRFAAVFEKQA